MRAIIVAITCFFSLAAFASPSTELAGLLSSYTTLKADFSQKTVDADHQVLQKSSGVMYVKKPHSFRFETNDPTHQIVFMDGKTVWIYDVDLQQATKQALSALPMNPAKLLSGDITVFLRDFRVTMQKKNNVVTFQLMPIKSTDAFRTLSILFKQNTLYAMDVQNNMGQLTQFSFSNLKTNLSLADSLFQFSPPADVDVLH